MRGVLLVSPSSFKPSKGEPYRGWLRHPVRATVQPWKDLIPLQIPTSNDFNHGLNMVQDLVNPQYFPLNPDPQRAQAPCQYNKNPSIKFLRQRAPWRHANGLRYPFYVLRRPNQMDTSSLNLDKVASAKNPIRPPLVPNGVPMSVSQSKRKRSERR